MRRRGAGAALVIGAALCASQAWERTPRQGILVRLDRHDRAATLTVREGTAVSRVALAPPSVSDRLRRVGVRDDLPRSELPPGSGVRLTLAGSGRKASVVAVERRVGPAATVWGTLQAEAQGYELWYARRFFDFGSWTGGDIQPAHTEARQALYIASRLIAAHSESWRDRRIWLRGRGDYLLERFRSAARTRAIVAEHGPPALLEHVETLEAAARAAAEETVVVHATLARPADSRDHPIGGWHWFPLAIYVDTSADTPLRRVFDGRPELPGEDRPLPAGDLALLLGGLVQELLGHLGDPRGHLRP